MSYTATDYYNIEDWQQLCDAISNAQDACALLGIPVTGIQDISIPRGEAALPTVELVNKMESNLQILAIAMRSSFSRVIWAGILAPGYVRNPTYEDWNRWALFAQQLNNLSNTMFTVDYTCGEFSANEI